MTSVIRYQARHSDGVCHFAQLWAIDTYKGFYTDVEWFTQEIDITYNIDS